MSLGWPGNASGSPQEELEEVSGLNLQLSSAFKSFIFGSDPPTCFSFISVVASKIRRVHTLGESMKLLWRTNTSLRYFMLHQTVIPVMHNEFMGRECTGNQFLNLLHLPLFFLCVSVQFDDDQEYVGQNK
ncbi:hypothetical protein L3Q82_006027 [Scortum barcoo]|uniref:Uncharacterized protein n=1 Tax=Scortum barcoo TaxID=214431 RepID=A0ACB8X2D0_9TELE|nr:hypothetical protein L3Q82_006027 [Scortum barcoo]